MKRNPTAFTLLELSIAISIVAFLLVLGISGAGEWRKRAYQAGCVGNLRSIGAALYGYASDHDGIVMPKAEREAYWHSFIDEYMGGRGRAIHYHAVSASAWKCGENQTITKAYKNRGYGDGEYTGYTINRHFLTSEDGRSVGIRNVRIANASRKVYVIEGRNVTNGATGPATTMFYPPYGYNNWLKPAHQGGNMVLFFDGHIELVTSEHELCSKQVNISGNWWLPER